MKVEDYHSQLFCNQAESKRYVDTVVVAIGGIELSRNDTKIGSDYLFAKRVVGEIEDRFQGRILVWPGIACRTTDRSANYVKEWIQGSFYSIHKSGFPYLILVNGTKQYTKACLQAADMLACDGQSVLVSNWWIDVEEELQQFDLDPDLNFDESSEFQSELLQLVVNRLSTQVVSLWK